LLELGTATLVVTLPMTVRTIDSTRITHLSSRFLIVYK
jgi:hypothetical protein